MTAEKSLRSKIIVPDQVIICPNCQTKIPLTEAISHQIREEMHKEFETEFEKKEKEIKKKLETEAKQKADEAAALEMQDLLAQVEEKDKKLQDAQKAELELRKQKRALEDSKRTFELEMIKKLDEEREKIKDDALKNVLEDHRFKDLEKEKQIEGMRKQIDELKRQAYQGSQQIQGEVFEDDLEKTLRAKFPHDCIEPVPKGARGADVLQKVQEITGLHCGTIIWESKNTKNWSDKWIEKLKDDQREVKADVAVLMTKVLPKDVSNFEQKNGVWVTDYSSVIGLATALRFGIIQVATTKRSSEGKNEKIEVLYKYLSSQEFRQKVEAIVEAFSSMKKDLDDEKKAMTKIWAKREKQLDRVSSNTVKIYGDMQGMIEANLPQIKSLELEALTDGSDGDEPEDDEKDELFEPKIPNKERIDTQIDTQLIKEKSGKNNEEISELIEDLDDDELKIYNCLKEDFSGKAENGDIAIKLRMGSTLVANRFNRLKSKGLVTEIREVEGGIKWKIVH